MRPYEARDFAKFHTAPTVRKDLSADPLEPARSYRATNPRVATSARISLVCVLLLAICSSIAFAQQGGGSILGTVYDARGARVPNARVVIRNEATAVEFSTVTNDSGLYTSPALPSGTYDVTTSAQGFERMTSKGVVVQVGSQSQVDMTLTVGQVSETVTVAASTPALNTTTGTLGAVIEDQQVHDLPLNGRNALALAVLTPGVNTIQGPVVEGLGDRGTALSQISIAGAPNASQATLLDGQNNVQGTTTGEVAINPTEDAVQEFNIQSGVMSAEYGYTLGGVITIATRSGTAKYHGTAYEFLRNDFFDARNYFATQGVVTKPEFRYDQYGATFGGKVPKIPVFAFGNVEHYYYNKSSPQYFSVPTQAERSGDFSQLYSTSGALIPLYDPTTTTPNPSGSGFVRSVFPGNIIKPLDQVAVAIQNMFYPLPNNTKGAYNAITQTNNYLYNTPTLLYMTQYFIRFDTAVTPKDTIFGRYANFDFKTGAPNSLLIPVSNDRMDHNLNRSMELGYTHIFSPSLMNDFRVGLVRNTFTFIGILYGQNWTTKLGLPSSYPGKTIPGISNGISGLDDALGNRSYTNPEVIETVTKTIKSHVLKMGTDLRINFGGNNQNNAPGGTYTFSAGLTGNPQNQSGTGSVYASYLLGQVASASLLVLEPTLDRQFAGAFFIQDDYKVSRRVMLNLGLRYEYQQIPYEQNNRYSNFNPYIKDSVNGLLGAMIYAGTTGVGRNFMNENYLDFCPRVGFAISLTNDGRTVLRGGYGIYHPMEYDSDYTGDATGYSNTTSYSAVDSNHAAFILSNGLPSPPIQPLGSALGPAAFLGSAVSYTVSHAPSPMSQQWNLAVEKELPYHVVVQVAYAGNHGTHLPQNGYPLNALPEANYSLGLALQNQVPNPYYGLVPASTSLGGPTISKAQSLLPYPYYTSINERFEHTGGLIAHFLEITAQRHMEKGLTLLFSFTGGKVIDVPVYSSETGAPAIAQNPFDLRAERSLNIYDVARRGSVTAQYALPFGHGQMFAARQPWVNGIIGGWKLNTIFVAQTGFPLAITGANNNRATRPNFVSGTSVSLPNPSLTQWFNTQAFVNPPSYTTGNVPRTLPNVRGPRALNDDLSVFKENEFADGRFATQLRLEMFNVFNHPNFAAPNTTFSPGTNGLNASGTFGVISSTSTDNRDIQLALKLIF